MNVVDLEEVSVSYQVSGRVLQALRQVNLSIGEAEIVTVVGESGCGKSTLGKVVLGVQPPTQGTVRYQGTPLFGPGFRWTRELRLGVQVVHQDSYASLNPVRRVGETLGDPIRRHGLAASTGAVRRKVEELLESVGLTPAEYFASKYPFQLSGGQRQRVSIARATILSPRLIVADEPVSGVDASLRLSILELMLRLKREQGIAFLYITHDLATARFVGSGGRLLVMYLGRVVEQGEVGMVLDNPRHPYLRALLAALPPLDPLEAKQAVPLPLTSLDMPDPSNPPPGCSFNPRCPLCQAICQTEQPLLEEHFSGHRVACHYPEGPPSPREGGGGPAGVLALGPPEGQRVGMG